MTRHGATTPRICAYKSLSRMGTDHERSTRNPEAPKCSATFSNQREIGGWPRVRWDPVPSILCKLPSLRGPWPTAHCTMLTNNALGRQRAVPFQLDALHRCGRFTDATRTADLPPFLAVGPLGVIPKPTLPALAKSASTNVLRTPSISPCENGRSGMISIRPVSNPSPSETSGTLHDRSFLTVTCWRR